MPKKHKPININHIDLDDLAEKTTDIPGIIEYAHTRGGFSVTPTKEGDIKAKAMNAMQEQTQMQLDMILEQMRLLAKQANDLKERAMTSELIYKAKMSFSPVIGETYFLYQQGTNQHVLSLIAPKEWGSEIPYEKFIATVKLLADHTWKIVEENKDQ